jgi:transposase
MDRARYAVDAVVVEGRSIRSVASSIDMSKSWVANQVARVLVRRGFVTPQPQKRPRSSWQRFEASLPNETWQADRTHRSVDDGTDEGAKVEILDFVDDY